MGVCYVQLGQIEQAIESFAAAVELDSDSAFAYSNLGVAYDSQGKYYQAIKAFKESIKVLLKYVVGWTYTKANPDEVERMRKEMEIE